MELNDEQRLAATHPQGEAALLLAGAGSGKTATLTERIAWLIEQGVKPRQILALTFTNKAAREICERVMRRVNLAPEQAPRLTTIHSLALSFIRRNPLGFGLDEKVTPLADYDQIEMLKKILERMGEDAPDSNAWAIRDKIAFHRARGVGFAEEYTAEVHERAKIEHNGYHAMGASEIAVWQLYHDEKRLSNTVDFDDMIAFVNRRFRQDPEWSGKVQKLFAHVLMDESQDTNFPAWQFVNNLLAPDNRNLYAIGDLSQSIFGFIGAAPHLIKEFSENWRGSAPKLYRLARNHRSVPEIVKLANAIQGKMTATISLVMESYRGMQGESGATKLLKRLDPKDLAARVAQEIVNTGRNFQQYAILVRASSQIRDIEGELIRLRIPYVVRGGRSLLQTEEVRDVLSYIKLAANPKDFSALSRSASAPRRGIGDQALETIRKVARTEHQADLVKAAYAMGGKTATFASVIKNIQMVIHDPLRALDDCIAFSGYRDYIKKKYAREPEKVEAKLENLKRLRTMVEGLAADSDLSAEDLIFQLTMDRTEQKDERGLVTISTIHAAKGLEWPTVFIFNVVEGVLPHQFARSEVEVEEERRLWYVAVTRARDICYITVASMNQLGRNLVEVDPSRFLTELNIA
jgi:superfamily I DNA/RNA helicase